MTDEEIKKTLEKFQGELDTYIAIKRKIETALDTDRDRDRALQIRLAQLQTDVQNFLAISLALFAGMGAFVVAFGSSPFSYQGIIFFIMIFIFAFYAIKSVRKAQSCREDMNHLG